MSYSEFFETEMHVHKFQSIFFLFQGFQGQLVYFQCFQGPADTLGESGGELGFGSLSLNQ